MMIRIVQFLAYFPPHKGWLEFHAQEWAKKRTEKWYGEVLNVVSSIGQKRQYWLIKEHWYTTLIVPAIEIIPTFPLPKFWTKKYRDIIKQIKTFDANFYQTRTRFFLFTFRWGILAKLHWKRWIHIEHGVDYVKLNTKWKNIIAWIYDRTLGRRTFRNANTVIWISQWCKHFAQKFTKKNIPVIYRGIEFNPWKRKEDKNTIRIGFVWRLVKLKGIEDIIKGIQFHLSKKQTKNIVFNIVWDWEERSHLEKLVKDLNLENTIKFLWFIEHKKVEKEFLPSTDIYINASYQEWLPPTVVEALLSECITIATKVWGTPEISDKEDLILVEPWKPKQIGNAIQIAIDWLAKNKGKSKKILKKKFNRDHNIKQYFELYNTL